MQTRDEVINKALDIIDDRERADKLADSVIENSRRVIEENRRLRIENEHLKGAVRFLERQIEDAPAA